MQSEFRPYRLILQRALDNSDGWRSVGRFKPDDAPTVQRAAEMLSEVMDVAWRVVVDNQRQPVLAIHNGRGWQAVAETTTVPAPMPWYQPAKAAMAEFARSRRAEEFATTIPSGE
jgi:hypothetical protein